MKDFEFGDTKTVRKSLIVACFVSFILMKLAKYGTPEAFIEFLTFKIPIGDSKVLIDITNYLVIFFLIVFIVRFVNDKLSKDADLLKQLWQGFKPLKQGLPFASGHSEMIDNPYGHSYEKAIRKRNIISLVVLFVDFVFPVLFAFFILVKSYLSIPC